MPGREKLRSDLRALIADGDRREIRGVRRAISLIERDWARLGELVELLWDDNAVVRMRAADALEKISRSRASLLQPWKDGLVGLMAETQQQEVRWHLAAILPRLVLTGAETRRVAELLWIFLEDRSSIVRTCAIQGLWELADLEKSMRAEVMDLVFVITQAQPGAKIEHARGTCTVTPAMQARGRKLLTEHSWDGI
jgi:hypothetical protein